MQFPKPTFTALHLSVSLLATAICAAPLHAQETVEVKDADTAGEAAPDPDVLDPDLSAHDIIVTAPRPLGSLDVPQQPVLRLEAEEITSYGASSLADLIAALGPQTGSGRGRGGGPPIILFNGQRVANFREFRNIPPEAVKRMEVLPEEVSLRYGFAPNQRVINFILRDNFASRSFDVEYEAPDRGGMARREFETSFLRFSKTGRFNVHLKAEDTSLLTEAERGVIQQPGTEPDVAGDPDPARFRSLVNDSRDLALTGSWSHGLGKDGTAGSLSANASITRNDSRALSGLNQVTLIAPGGASAVRTLGDPLYRDSRTVQILGGGAYNTAFGTWQFTATVDGSSTDTQTRIARRADLSGLVTAAAAGTLDIAAALPPPENRGFDLSRSKGLALTSLATLAGTPFSLPAGPVMLTLKAGYGHRDLRSSDTRAGTGVTRLSREDRNLGFNLALPITSRGEAVLGGLGDIALNFSAGLSDLSDFGAIKDWSAGLTWGLTEKLDVQASYLTNEAAPLLTQLGNPLAQSFNVPVYDFSRGETVLVTIVSGGNPALRREKQRDLKLGMNWQMPIMANSSLLIEYFRNRSSNVTADFPLLTPEIEAAFPGRVQRDGSGRLIAIDRRPVTFAGTQGERLRWGLNFSGTIGKPRPQAQAGGQAGAQGAGGPPLGGPPRMGMGGGPRGPGGPRMGGGGGPMMGMMGGGGNGQGRWNLSVFHTVRFVDRVTVARGGPVLDLLDGDATSGGGALRHQIELDTGGFYRGFGLRVGGTWNAPTTLKASGAPGTSDLRFGSTFVLNLRTFINFDQQAAVLKAVPFLKGARLSFVADNLLDSRQKVTDGSGAVPISYQKALIDPRGRVLGIDFRKVF